MFNVYTSVNVIVKNSRRYYGNTDVHPTLCQGCGEPGRTDLISPMAVDNESFRDIDFCLSCKANLCLCDNLTLDSIIKLSKGIADLSRDMTLNKTIREFFKKEMGRAVDAYEGELNIIVDLTISFIGKPEDKHCSIYELIDY